MPIESSRPSLMSLIPKPPSGTPYFVAIGVIVVMVGAMMWWKFGRPQPVQPQPQPVVLSVSATQTTTSLGFDLPPPPELDSGADAQEAGSGPTHAIGPNPCAGPCSGDAPAALRSALAAAGAASRSCYERALRNNAMLAGKLVVGVRVASSGNICLANVVSDQLGSPEVSQCVLSQFRGRNVPKPTGGNCADVNVPLAFTAAQGRK